MRNYNVHIRWTADNNGMGVKLKPCPLLCFRYKYGDTHIEFDSIAEIEKFSRSLERALKEYNNA